MIAPSTLTSSHVVAGFHALSEPLRIQVLELLRTQELCVCELCESLGVTQSKLSFHLKTLKEAGLIRARQDGRWIYYSLNLPQFVVLERYLAEYRRFAVMYQHTPPVTRRDASILLNLSGVHHS
jgi:ArsR family transcriptional regulator